MHSINTSKGEATDVGVFSDNSKITVFKFLESAELAYLGRGNSIQKANRLYNKHLSDKIKFHLILLSDDYAMMKTWLITYSGGPSRIVGDIVGNLPKRAKQAPDNRKDQFSFYSVIIGAIQRLERLSSVSYINGAELESCLSTLSSLISLLPAPEYDLWVREMTVAGLDFRNPVGLETFVFFKKVCIIERNTNEISGPSPTVKITPTSNDRKTARSTHRVQCQEEEGSENYHEVTVLAARELSTKPLPEFKFPSPISYH